MNFKVVGDNDCPLVQISLKKDETITIESGAMSYMADVQLEGKMNSKKSGLGGILSAIGRSIASGENIFITKATGLNDNGLLGIAPPLPGRIKELQVSGDTQYRLNTGCFLACDSSVNYNIVSQDVGKALLGGTGGLFVMETEGTGSVLVSSFGDILAINVTPDRSITIDNDHVVAWDKNLDYTIQAASGTFGFKTGEGFADVFSGTGKVYVQTRNLAALAQEIRRYIPTQSSND